MGKVWSGRMAVVMGLLAVILLVGGQAFAQEGAAGGKRAEGAVQGQMGGMKEGMKQGMQEAKQCPMCQMREGQMMTMGEVQQLLADAKAAADKGDSATASAKIAKAQEMLQQHHKKMMNMDAEYKDKCPMCGKMINKGQMMKEGMKEEKKP